MGLWILYLKSRLRISALTGICLLIGTSVSVGPFPSFGWVSSDYSGVVAVLIPGLTMTLVMTIGLSDLTEFEATARPIPEAITLFTMLAATMLAAGVSTLAFDDGRPGLEYGAIDVVRNHFAYLAIGLTPAVWGKWDLAPHGVYIAAILTATVFGISRADSPLLYLANPTSSSTEMLLSPLLAGMIAATILARRRNL